jgi:hypothetical protein
MLKLLCQRRVCFHQCVKRSRAPVPIQSERKRL